VIARLGALVVPAVMLVTVAVCLIKGVDIFDALSCGIRDGLGTVAAIFPSLVAVLAAVAMLRASGAVELLTRLLAPVFSLLGLPPETAPLMLIRPISGSGALSVASELIGRYGADSLIGRTAAVMLGSTETTFYVLAVYFGSLGLKQSRRALLAALAADLAGFVTAALCARLLWG